MPHMSFVLFSICFNLGGKVVAYFEIMLEIHELLMNSKYIYVIYYEL